MAATVRPVLYGLARSVYTRVARLALEEKSVAYDLEPTEIFGPEGVPAEHLARHPFGRIPVLAHGDFVLYETGAITRYVDEAFPGPALQPVAPRQRARMTQAIGVLDAYGYRPMVWGVFVQRVRLPLRGGRTDEAEVVAAWPQVERVLAALARIQEGADYLAGAQLSLADLHALPMLAYLALDAQGAARIAAHPGLAAWLARMQARASVRATRTEYEPAAS